MRVGFTGTRHGMTSLQLGAFLSVLRRFSMGDVLHHGGCLGADTQAHALAKGRGLWIVVHPALESRWSSEVIGDETRPVRSPLARNRDIVDETSLLIAAPRTTHEELRSGTWATWRYARRLGREIFLILPDGRIYER